MCMKYLYACPSRWEGGRRLYGGLNFTCGKQGILSGEGESGGVSGYGILYIKGIDHTFFESR